MKENLGANNTSELQKVPKILDISLRKGLNDKDFFLLLCEKFWMKYEFTKNNVLALGVKADGREFYVFGHTEDECYTGMLKRLPKIFYLQ